MKAGYSQYFLMAGILHYFSYFNIFSCEVKDFFFKYFH